MFRLPKCHPRERGDPDNNKERIQAFARITCPWLIILLLTGCSSRQGDKLLKNIRHHAHKEHKIEHGELLAKYNVLGISGANKCLFAKDYGDIVGAPAANKKFITKMDAELKRNPQKLSFAKNKISAIYDRLNLKHKYSLTSLVKADHMIKDVPAFLPMTSPLLTSKFGKRGKRGKFHAGVDLAGAKGANIYSAAAGVVLEIAASRSYGNYALLQHKGDTKTRYAHLSKLYVRAGDHVFQGELLGKQGSTGHSSGDHLHFEIIHKNKAVDPFKFIGQEYTCHSVNSTRNGIARGVATKQSIK